MARYLAIICILLQVPVAYHGYTQCLILMSPEIQELCQNACPQDPDPEPAAGCCGGSSCPMESQKPQGCGHTQKAPPSQKSCTMPDGNPKCCIAICSYVAGIPSEKLLIGSVDYSLHTPNDLIGICPGSVAYIFSNAPPLRSVHPAISTTVLRI